MFDFHPECRGGEREEAFEQRLLAADWEDALGPLRLNANLQPEELRQAWMYREVVVLLHALLEEGGTRATPKGYLNGRFVARVAREMCMMRHGREFGPAPEVLNERSERSVHMARMVAEAGGLIRREQGRYVVTEAAREWMGEEAAGALYRRVFVSYFRHFDWRLDTVRDLRREVGKGMAVSLWRLGKLAASGASIESLVPRVLRPEALKDLQGKDRQAWKWSFTLLLNLLIPLEDFNLVRVERPKDAPAGVSEEIVRLTTLWSRFVRFGPVS